MLSSRSDFAAKICQHMTLSTARRSHGLTLPHKHRSSAGTAVARNAAINHSTAPTARSPRGVLGNILRSTRSNALIVFPISTTGCGRLCGSPRTQSMPKPMRSGKMRQIMVSPPTAS